MNVKAAFKNLDTGQLHKLHETVSAMLLKAEAEGSEKDRHELGAMQVALSLELQGRGQ